RSCSTDTPAGTSVSPSWPSPVAVEASQPVTIIPATTTAATLLFRRRYNTLLYSLLTALQSRRSPNRGWRPAGRQVSDIVFASTDTTPAGERRHPIVETISGAVIKVMITKTRPKRHPCPGTPNTVVVVRGFGFDS